MSQSEEFQKLSQHLAQIDLRLDRIEKEVFRSSTASSEPKNDGVDPAVREFIQRQKAGSHKTAKKAQVDSSGTTSTGMVLGIIGAICFMLAGVFIVKLVYDSGWLTPIRQVGIAALFGLSLIGSGLFLHRSDRSYFSLLPASGLVILYLSSLAAHLYYDLLSVFPATACLVLISTMALALFFKLREFYFGAIAVLGTYLSPIILGQLQAYDFQLSIYFLVWALVFSGFSIMSRSRELCLIAAYGGLASFFTLGVAYRWDPAYVASIQLVQFLIYAGGVAFYSIYRKEKLSAVSAWAYFPLILFFYAIEYRLVQQIDEGVAPYLGLAFAALVNLLYFLTRKSFQDAALKSGQMLHALTAVVLVHCLYFELGPSATFDPWIGLGLALMIPLLGAKIDWRGQHIGYLIAILFVFSINYLHILFVPESFENETSHRVSMIAYAAVLLAAYPFGMKSVGGARSSSNSLSIVLFFAAHIQAIAGFYHIGNDFGEYARFIVSALWLLYATAILLWARAIKDRLLAQSALGVFAIAVAKALLFDVESTQPIIRIFCFLLLGGALFFGGHIFRQISSWK